MTTNTDSDIRNAVDIRFNEWVRESNLLRDMFRMYSGKMDDEQVKFLLQHAFVEGMVFGVKYAGQQTGRKLD